MVTKLVNRAMKAGKNIYCEKPVSETLKDALDLVRVAKKYIDLEKMNLVGLSGFLDAR